MFQRKDKRYAHCLWRYHFGKYSSLCCMPDHSIRFCCRKRAYKGYCSTQNKIEKRVWHPTHIDGNSSRYIDHQWDHTHCTLIYPPWNKSYAKTYDGAPQCHNSLKVHGSYGPVNQTDGKAGVPRHACMAVKKFRSNTPKFKKKYIPSLILFLVQLKTSFIQIHIFKLKALMSQK